MLKIFVLNFVNQLSADMEKNCNGVLFYIYLTTVFQLNQEDGDGFAYAEFKVGATVQHLIFLPSLKYVILCSSQGFLNTPWLKCTIYVV